MHAQTRNGRSVRLLAFATGWSLALHAAPYATPVPRPPGAIEPRSSEARLLWQTPIGGRGTPIADETSIYFVSMAHDLVAVARDTGIVRWQRKLTGDAGPNAPSGNEVAFGGPLVIAGDHDVTAFDRTTGAFAWRFAPVDGYGAGLYLGAATPDTIVAGSPAGRLYAIDARTGRVRWSVLVSADSRTTVFRPQIHGDLVVATHTTFTAPTTGGVVAVRLGSGRELWRRAFPRETANMDASMPRNAGAAGGPVILDRLAFAADSHGTIHAFAIDTGRIEWSLPWSPPAGALPAAAAPMEFRALTTANGLLVAGSLQGTVTAYDVRTRGERWRYYDRSNGSAGFRIGSERDRVFVPYAGGGLVELRAADGAEIGRIGAGFTGLSSPPCVSAGQIYVSSQSGLLAFEQRR